MAPSKHDGTLIMNEVIPTTFRRNPLLGVDCGWMWILNSGISVFSHRTWVHGLSGFTIEFRRPGGHLAAVHMGVHGQERGADGAVEVIF